MTICRECNNGFSRDEQYAVTFLSCVLAGTTEPDRQPNASAGRALAKSPSLRAAIERARADYETQSGEARAIWQPDLARFNRVILKNARGHAFFEFGEPMLEAPVHVRAFPLESLTADERDEFEGFDDGGLWASWPEVGSRMMTRVWTGQDMDGSWVVVQEGIYRYAVHHVGGLWVRSVLYEYLATEVLWLD